MKHFNVTIGNRSRHLPACSAMPQLAAPLQLVRILVPIPFNVADAGFLPVYINAGIMNLEQRVASSIFRSVISAVYLRTKYTNTCRKAVKNTTTIVIYKVLVYIQMSQPTTCFGLFYLGHLQVGYLVRGKYTIVLYNN